VHKAGDATWSVANATMGGSKLLARGGSV